MMRKDFTPGSECVALSVGMTNDAVNREVNDFRHHQRLTPGGSMTSVPPTEAVVAAYPQVWLRLRRKGDTVTSFVGRNAVDWVETGSSTLPLSATADVLWGVTCSAYEPGKRALATIYFQTARIQRWTFPGVSACAACHNATSGWVLGVNTRQLNCSFTYPATKVRDNQLRAWNYAGYFGNSGPMEQQLPTLERLFAVGDVSASLEQRARAYLDVNCASCHRPGAAQAQWDARWETPLAQQGILGAAPLKDLGLTGIKLIDPGNVDNSLIHLRTNMLGAHQMPPLGKNFIDAAGVKLLGDWISSLPPAQD
jgi:mono/diheme cytochrome c family protein